MLAKDLPHNGGHLTTIDDWSSHGSSGYLTKAIFHRCDDMQSNRIQYLRTPAEQIIRLRQRSHLQCRCCQGCAGSGTGSPGCGEIDWVKD